MAMIMCLIFGLRVLFVFLKARSHGTIPTSLSSTIVETLSLDYVERIYDDIITVRKRSCGKVMFLHLSVSHSLHRGVSA